MKATIHWVSAAHAVDAEVRLYDRLFTVETPRRRREGRPTFVDTLNPQSLEVLHGCKLEPIAGRGARRARASSSSGSATSASIRDGQPGAPVFNRTVTLKDTWAKVAARAS